MLTLVPEGEIVAGFIHKQIARRNHQQAGLTKWLHHRLYADRIIGIQAGEGGNRGDSHALAGLFGQRDFITPRRV